jgi:putative SOS response-associated peptidase YedK
MCGRYTRSDTPSDISAWFDVASTDIPVFAPSFNIAPQSTQPVIRLNQESGSREIALMRWGLVPFWSKDTKPSFSTINARAETVATSATYREPFKRRRCLVPANAFYEWQRLDEKHKQPYAIALAGNEPLAFAGVWDSWRDKVTGQFLESYSILTTEPNELMAGIHNRMPVILSPDEYQRWIMHGEHPPSDLMKPYPPEKMKAWMVGAEVGNVRNNSPELLKPLVN